jgi:hypothetical protein
MKDNEILKSTLLHYINLEYYANELDEEYQTLLNKLTARCNSAILSQISINTKSYYNLIMKVIKEEADSFRNKLEEELDEAAEYVMNQELKFLNDTYNGPIEKGNSVNYKALALGGIALKDILFAPIDDKDTTKEFVERTKNNIINAYESSLRSGYLFGKSSEELVNQATNKMKQVSRGMQSGIRTAIPSYAKNTDRIVFLNNNEEVIWCSTLDGRTCISCAALSGLHFKSIAEAPGIQHTGCRCVCMIASSVKEPVPEFDEFIKMLDEEDQKKVLGTNRFKLWKDYNVNLTKFINSGTKVSWKELESKYSEELSADKENRKTELLVKKKYPKEEFVSRKITKQSSLYVSKERIRAGAKDPLVYESDKMMATTIVKHTNRDFYMLSENGVFGVKSPDGFYKLSTIEMKHVTGSLKKVGVNAVRALRQSPNVFIYVDKNYSIEACLDKIRGSIKNTRAQMGKDFIEPQKDDLLLIFTGDKLYEYTWNEVL